VIGVKENKRKKDTNAHKNIGNEKKCNYETFLPKDNLNNQTVEALKFFVEDSKARNIGVIGNFGSGKSSIINSYLTKSKKNYIIVSLASFEETECSDSKTTNQQIEVSILQQLLLKRDKNRFLNKEFFKNYLVTSLFLAFIIWVMLLLGLNLYNLYLENIKIVFNDLDMIYTILLGFSTFLLLNFIVVCIYNKLIEKFYLSSISIKNMEIKIEGQTKTIGSIISANMKKIIDTFSKRKIELVIFEDLDRYKDEWIFIKLRELCNVINEADNTEEVVFVYSVKDELFSKKVENRMKFFDAIIPIIPSMTSYNSFEVFKTELFTEEGSSNMPSDEILKEVSNFIYDRRMATNIYNEYLLYLENLETTNVINFDQLFGFIVYKNMFPEDFTKLQENKGAFYSVIHDNQEYNYILINELDKELEKLNTLIDNSKKSNLNIQHLRLWHLVKFFEKNPNYKQYISMVNLIEYTSEEKFDEIKNGQLKNVHNLFRDFAKQFNEYLSSADVSSEFEYANNLLQKKLRENNSKVKQLRHNRNEQIFLKLKDKMANPTFSNEIKKLISKILSKNIIDINAEETNEYIYQENNLVDLMVFLIKKGYIAEDYTNYITYFKEGKKTINDREFVKIVFGLKEPKYDLPLSGFEELLKDLKDLNLYSSKDILNYNFLEYLCLNDKNIYLEKIISGLKSNLVDRLDFIKGYFYSDMSSEAFLKKVLEYWPCFFDDILQIEPNDQELLYMFFNKSLEFFNADDFSVFYSNNPDFVDFLKQTDDFSNFTENNLLNFLHFLPDKYFKFTRLDEKYKKTPIMDFIKNNNIYSINIHNIEVIIEIDRKDIGLFSQAITFDDKVKDYLNENILVSIGKLIIDNNTYSDESEEIILDIINNQNISIMTIEEVLKKQLNLKVKYDRINSFELLEVLINRDQIEFSWDLINYLYDKNVKLEVINSIFSLNTRVNEIIQSENIITEDNLKLVYNKVLRLNMDLLIYSNLVESMNIYIEKIDDIDTAYLNVIIEKDKILFSKEIFKKLLMITNVDIVTYLLNKKSQFLDKIDEFKSFLTSDLFNIIWESNKAVISEKILFLELFYKNNIIDYDLIKKNLSVNNSDDYYNLYSNIKIYDVKCILLDSNKEKMTKQKLIIELQNLKEYYLKLVSRSVGVQVKITPWNKSILTYLRDKAKIVSHISEGVNYVVNTRSESSILQEHNEDGVITE